MRDLASRSDKHSPWIPHTAEKSKRYCLEKALSLIDSRLAVRCGRRVSDSAAAHIARARADGNDPVIARGELPSRKRLGPSRVVSIACRSPDRSDHAGGDRGFDHDRRLDRVRDSLDDFDARLNAVLAAHPRVPSREWLKFGWRSLRGAHPS